MKKIDNKTGAALIVSMFVVIILLSISSMFIFRAVQENNISKIERSSLKAFHLAEAASQLAIDELDNLINNYMRSTINRTNPSTVINTTQNYVSSQDGTGFLCLQVKNESNVPQLIMDSGNAIYTKSSTALGEGIYNYNIIMSEKSDPMTIGSTAWDFPYSYRIEAASTVAGITKQINLTGDFTVRIQKDNFAKYALFTNNQAMPDGTYVWFTDKTSFEGPIHTNGRYNFAFKPSGVFDGAVVQHEQSARFYNNGSYVLINGSANGTRDVPVFNGGFTRGANAITLSSSVQKQDLIDQADGGQSFSSNGIYIPNDGASLTGGIYVHGNANISLAVNGSNDAVYTITQGSTTKTVTVDKTNNQTKVISGATENIYQGIPDGVDNVGTIIFVNGNINSLSGTVQEQTQLTISSEDNITITNHLRYSDYVPASGTPGTTEYVPPSAEDKTNLLGLVTWDGDIVIGTSAPDNINIHGSLLAQNGVFKVDRYADTGLGTRGTATLLGGVITDDYGAFGQFNGSTGAQISGYGRNFVYDQRMEAGNAPPYFPSLNTFIAFTNDITDKIVWQEAR